MQPVAPVSRIRGRPMHVVCAVHARGASGRASPVAMLRYLDSLRSWQLLLLAAALLFADLLIPDPIPFLDELLLGVLTYALARWKKPPP